MNNLEQIYLNKCSTALDINEHLPTLRRYTEECDVVIEMGVRSIVSTWAFLLGQPKKLISVDIVHPKTYINHDPSGCNLDLVYEIAEEREIEFEFIESDTLKMDPIECDFLFIDTLHDYDQLKEELRIHSSFVKKYIGLHDTETFAIKGETTGKEGIWRAVEEFLSEGEWRIEERFTNNNGLTILSRI
jgi:hypothetical protein